MINFRVEIYDATTKAYIHKRNAIFPPKFAELLDEQLDECQIEIKGDSVEYYKAFTRVRITITNNPETFIPENLKNFLVAQNENETNITYDSETKKITETLTKEFFVANDRAVETPVGSERYNHEIYLIELTKILERYISDSLTFTNALAVNPSTSLTNNAYFAFSFTYIGDTVITQNTTTISSIEEVWAKGQSYTIPLPLTFFNELISNDSYINNIFNGNTINAASLTNGAGVWVKDKKGNIVYSKEITITPVEINKNEYTSTEQILNADGTLSTIIAPDISDISSWCTGTKDITIYEAGRYTIEYKSGVAVDGHFEATSSIEVLASRYPIKKWTITDVLNRVFDLVEPLNAKIVTINDEDIITQDFPLFVLQGVTYDQNGKRNATYTSGSIAEEYDKILSPEFNFTQSTLREVLQQVGGFTHAEPRVIGEGEHPNGKKYYIVSFDKYGIKTLSKISNRKYITATFGADINQYCTAIDSNASNLVNSVGWAKGAIIEPFNNYQKTLRSEQTLMRLEDNDTTIISTQFPIYELGGDKTKVYCIYSQAEYDITPFIYEKADYDLLSNYEGGFPFSKAYALYYAQGQNNIKGLFFKSEHAVNSVFRNYAIVNILRAVSGIENLLDEATINDYTQLQFRVEYIPITATRVKTHKQFIDNEQESTLVYNQSANLVETSYYSANLQGVVERMGNIEKSYTYELPLLSQIPKIGTKFDDNYYISNVNFELYPAHIKCTVHLSKHFNRKSEYIGINSQRRMYEISEKQAQLRQSIYTNYVVISKENDETDKNINYSMGNIAQTLLSTNTTSNKINSAQITCFNANFENLQDDTAIILPVIATPFANSMIFTVSFADNYSAGQKLIYASALGSEMSYWGANVPYTDYYGRVYYLRYALFGGNQLNKIFAGNVNTLPEGSYTNSSIRTRTLLYRKDNREIPQLAEQLTVVTDDENIIIGAELCRNCELVTSAPKSYKLYLLPKKLSLLDNKIDLSGAIEKSSWTISGSVLTLPKITIQEQNPSVAWALVTETTTETLTVNTEIENETTTQTITTGGELLLGANEQLSTTATTNIYFNFKTKIY